MPTTSLSRPFSDALDIVFEDRNRAYGAYQLRRAYPRYLTRALLLGIFCILAAIAVPHVISMVQTLTPEAPLVNVIAEPGPPPDIIPTAPPPPPPPLPTPPPPPRSMQRFVPPAVLKDDEVQEKPQTTIDDLLQTDKEIGKKEVAGTDDEPPSIQPAEIPAIIEEPKKAPDEEVREMFDVNKPPTFPGGERELLKFLASNIQYPALARDATIQGTVVLSFVVDKQGNTTDIEVVRDIGGGCGKEAMRVIGMMPRWMPGEANGHPVRVRYKLPVRFKLE
jgi:protein TonB